MNCDKCNKGKMVETTWSKEAKLYNTTVKVEGLLSRSCNNPDCDEVIIMPDHIRHNEALTEKAKQDAIGGGLTPKQVRRLREQMGLSQRDAAKVFGGGEHAFSKYERNRVQPNQAMCNLIEVAAKYHSVLIDLCQKAGVSLPAHISGEERYHSLLIKEAFNVKELTKKTRVSQPYKDDVSTLLEHWLSGLRENLSSDLFGSACVNAFNSEPFRDTEKVMGMQTTDAFSSLQSVH